MPTDLALQFRVELDTLGRTLTSLSPEPADVPWRPGGWTRKQIVGHLLDSATNNRQRFVRAAIEGGYTGPSYEQDAWVAAHGYQSQTWETLLRWWHVEHEILAAVVDRIPEGQLSAICAVGGDDPVTLRFLIGDYIAHQKHHLEQIAAGTGIAGT
jgi:hypothetical protein